MIDHNVGVTLATRYDIKKIDLDYFAADDDGSIASRRRRRTPGDWHYGLALRRVGASDGAGRDCPRGAWANELRAPDR